MFVFTGRCIWFTCSLYYCSVYTVYSRHKLNWLKSQFICKQEDEAFCVWKPNPYILWILVILLIITHDTDPKFSTISLSLMVSEISTFLKKNYLMTLCDLNIWTNDYYLVSHRQGLAHAYLPPKFGKKLFKTASHTDVIINTCVTSLFDPLTIWVGGELLN